MGSECCFRDESWEDFRKIMGKPVPEKNVDISNVIPHKVYTGVVMDAGNYCGPAVQLKSRCSLETRSFTAMKKILIVDDQQLLLYGLEKALKTETTEVTITETGKVALTEIASSLYDLCFLDIFLPDMNGVDLLNRFRELSPATKVIMMTAGIITDSMKENIEKNAYMFISKPFDLLQVKMLAKRVLESSSPRC